MFTQLQKFTLFWCYHDTSILLCTIDNLYDQRIHSRYFSPQGFKEQNKYVIDNDDNSFSIFHDNLISLSKNFENLQSSILDEPWF